MQFNDIGKLFFLAEKLNVLAKEVKEKERQERIKMREKTEGSSDVSIASFRLHTALFYHFENLNAFFWGIHLYPLPVC